LLIDSRVRMRFAEHPFIVEDMYCTQHGSSQANGGVKVLYLCYHKNREASHVSVSPADSMVRVDVFSSLI